MNLTKAVVDKMFGDGSGPQLRVTIDSGGDSTYPVSIEDAGPHKMLLTKEDVAWLREALYQAYYAVYGEIPK